MAGTTCIAEVVRNGNTFETVQTSQTDPYTWKDKDGPSPRKEHVTSSASDWQRVQVLLTQRNSGADPLRHTKL